MSAFVAAFAALLDGGGFVMPWLVGGAFVLWAALGWRAMSLMAPGRRGTVAQLVARERDGKPVDPDGAWSLRDQAIGRVVRLARGRSCPPHAVVDEVLLDLRGVLGGGRVLVRTLVVLAPLAGLLGTVTGMIETFRSLADMALFTQGGGIAGGIAEALLTTQMGLAISVPGLVVGRALDRREAVIHEDLDLLTELVCTRPLPEIGPEPTGGTP